MSSINATLGSQLNIETTVLLMWDLQKILVSRAFNKVDLLVSAQALLAGARHLGIPVVYAKLTPLPPQWEAGPRLLQAMQRTGIDDPDEVPQPPEGLLEIVPEIAPLVDELVIAKHTTSMFIGTHFHYLLQNRGIQNIILCGVNTENGIIATARDASNRGYYPVVAADAVSSSDQEAHEMSLQLMKRFCRVEMVQSILQAAQV